MFGSLFFLLHECWLNLRRQGLMALASISTAAISLTILGVFVLLAWQVHSIAASAPRQFEVHAFLKPEITAEQAEDLSTRLHAVPGVVTVKRISRDQAWTELRKGYRSSDLEGMTNPLPDKLEITAITPERTLEVAEQVRAMPEVDNVNEGRETLRLLIRIANLVRIGGLALAALLAIGTAAIISNVIRITLFARRRDIRVMQLVGATNGFIRLPFLLEGTFAGAVGGGVACGAMAGALYYLQNWTHTSLPFINELRVSLDVPLFCGALVLAGALLGAFGSLFSLRRFLRPA